MSTRDSSEERVSQRPSRASQSSLMTPTLPQRLTGDKRVLSTLSRTRLNVDHAGLSPLPLPLRESTSSRLASSSNWPSNNWLTVTLNPMDVMEVSRAMLSTTPRKILKSLRKTTHTRDTTDTAKPRRAWRRSRLPDTKLSSTTVSLSSRLPLPSNQLVSVLMLPEVPGKCTTVESSTTRDVDMILTTLSPLLDTVKRANTSISS